MMVVGGGGREVGHGRDNIWMDDVSYHTHTLYAGSCDEMDGWMGTIEGVNAGWWYVHSSQWYIQRRLLLPKEVFAFL